MTDQGESCASHRCVFTWVGQGLHSWHSQHTTLLPASASPCRCPVLGVHVHSGPLPYTAAAKDLTPLTLTTASLSPNSHMQVPLHVCHRLPTCTSSAPHLHHFSMWCCGIPCCPFRMGVTQTQQPCKWVLMVHTLHVWPVTRRADSTFSQLRCHPQALQPRLSARRLDSLLPSFVLSLLESTQIVYKHTSDLATLLLKASQNCLRDKPMTLTHSHGCLRRGPAYLLSRISRHFVPHLTSATLALSQFLWSTVVLIAGGRGTHHPHGQRHDLFPHVHLHLHPASPCPSCPDATLSRETLPSS